MPLRDRYTAFIEKHEVAWELTFATLAAAFVVIGFAQDDAAGQEAIALGYASLLLSVVFGIEFGTRIYASRDRRGYLRGHWIDVVALVPYVRSARLLRLLRLLRLVRTFAGIYRALASIERFTKHRNLIWLFATWLGVAVISSTALFLAESDVNPNIRTPVDALWWGIVTLTTVGYGDVYPVTPEGRLAGATLMIVGITLFAAITGTITSLLIAQNARNAVAPGFADLIVQLGDLRDKGLISADEFDTKKRELLDRV